MGYGLAIWLDNEAVRTDRHSDQELLDTFKAVVGTDSYPTGGMVPVTAGPWRLAGAYHSTQLAVLHADTTGIFEGPAPVDDSSLTWVGPLDGRTEQDAYRNLSRNPQAAAAIAGGVDIYEAVFGPNRNANAPVSIWVLLADSLNYIDHLDAATFSDEVKGGIEDRRRGSVRIGSHGSGLSRHGAVLAGGQATFVWSGNRICAASELTEAEQVTYQRHMSA